MKLTPKQEKFVHKYLECSNASEAYRSAFSCENWKDKSIWERASTMLKNNKVQSRLKELQDEIKAKSDITKEKVLAEFAKVGFSSIAHLHNTWIDRKALEELTPDQKAAIKSISTRTRKVLMDNAPTQIEEIKIELYDKLRALESINKMLGFDAPKDINLNLINPFEEVNPQDIAKLLNPTDE